MPGAAAGGELGDYVTFGTGLAAGLIVGCLLGLVLILVVDGLRDW